MELIDDRYIFKNKDAEFGLYNVVYESKKGGEQNKNIWGNL